MARIRALIKHVVLIAFGLVMVYPLLWMIASSVKPDALIFREPSLLPTQTDFGHYADGWNALSHPFGVYLLNSAIVVLGALLGNLVSCSMAAYAFARLKFRGRAVFFGMMLLTLMVPIYVLIIPQYVMFSEIGWVNTFLPLIVPKFLATDAFFIFLMVQFFRGLPTELDEAAKIDGAGYWRIYFRILLPISLPALATTAIFTFIWTWNDFLSQLIYLTKPELQTAPVALRNYVDATSGASWGSLFAMSVITLIPVFIVFLVGQRYLVKGIATTGMK
ncbi:carbohydrate ABC transporter permease [Streptomyces caniscabiei]|uniref:Carbohydrate ABC transporter permease n=1 Tax=Streptomyces caniscabiei TaxID=2746961 RepID=A0ABU4N3R2_9ACTN|nr:carbohydrate ABC transporter permease [Streptomyces caniscabiei]MDX2948393.1 carbohydrate ABC transporter permease [Streptomyces caniscabiei]MDX2957701.1 carbohydrate ABC transporter permease [Streptomyces caniscabiei]MDX2989074.1 carbohydrate ABC transporter permease [Streptomyces caniscabiei]MDX3015691.1 carbohydrate ABC transporter permease [Streptomyces caniscabiei]MDX3044190.1 carbohydrate ABC transporter permease [Streptomyces caniscabiei]